MIEALLVFVAALTYSAVGHGGASGYLAVMALLGTAPATMRVTALALNVGVSAIASAQFARVGAFRWRLFLPLALASVPAAFIGGRLALPDPAYRTVVGIVLLVSAARFMLRAPSRPGRPHPGTWMLLLVGAMLGLLAGMTGVGGGIFLSPVLVLLGWADIRTTAATSAPFILVNSLAGLAARPSALEDIHPSIAWLALAAMGGGLIGSTLGARRLSHRAIGVVLALVLALAGWRLVTGG